LACILTAANEIVVEAFLKGKITFPDIWIVNEQIMQKATFIDKPTLDDYIATDREARIYASEIVSILQMKN
jgi:1-deoxy-D-xylulose-5-phosphate reductoisomerase